MTLPTRDELVCAYCGAAENTLHSRRCSVVRFAARESYVAPGDPREALARQRDETFKQAAKHATALGEIELLRAALVECAKHAGEDVSDGPPESPWIGEWAIQAVKELRESYIEAGGG